MLKSIAFSALSFFLRNIFNLSEKMTDNRFNFCGFPPKLVKFAESAYRASVLQQKKETLRPLKFQPVSDKSDLFFYF